MALGLNTYADVGQREVGRCGLGNGNRLNTVTLVVSHGIQGIIQIHIRIQRIILGARFFLRHTIVKRCRHLGLVREELTQLNICCQRVGLIIIRRALHHAFLQASESFSDNLSCQIE